MGRQIEKAKALERAFRLPTIVGAQKLDFFAVLHAKLSQMTALSYHTQVAGVLQAQKILPLILLFCHTLPCRPLAAVRELGRSRAVIPTVIDQNPCAHLRMPRDMIFHGWSMRLFQAWQHSATMSS